MAARSVSNAAPKTYQDRIERLFYQATNPCNEREDVNVIKQLCDTVSQAPEGPLIATRLLAHKIQSPHDQEALLALAVLEAGVKACGMDFQAEVGKFRFLNEMVKLVSPKYSGSRTPDHVKLKVIELLYLWTKEIPHEKKIVEAYEMLKSQGLVETDPDYVKGAVFPTSVTPRTAKSDLDDAESKRLQKLLHSSNPEDIEAANQIIKSMVKKDEEKMEKVTKRVTLIDSVNTNIKLLTELLDNYNANTSTSDERELVTELGEACEKVRPNIYRVASEMEEGDEAIGEILLVSDELTRVIDRYRTVIVRNNPDPHPRQPSASVSSRSPVNESNLDSLLNIDLSPNKILDNAASGLKDLLVRQDLLDEDSSSATLDLLSEEPVTNSENLIVVPSLSQNPIPNLLDASPNSSEISLPVQILEQSLDSLDVLGESLMKQNLPSDKEASFSQKRNEKLPMNILMKQKSETTTEVTDLTSQLPVSLMSPVTNNGANGDDSLLDTTKEAFKPNQEELYNPSHEVKPTKEVTNPSPVNLNDIQLQMSEIIPEPSLAPVIVQAPELGLAVSLHFTKNKPRDGVSVVILSLANHHPQPVSDLELRVVLSRGWKQRLSPFPVTQLSGVTSFSPPASTTAMMLVTNTGTGVSPCSLSYFLSYSLDGETVSDMGKNYQISGL